MIANSTRSPHYTGRGNQKSPTRSELHAAALRYARRDWPVFPCVPGDKRPLTSRGHLDATTDPSRITSWWNRWPNANIGVPTGERSGLLVLDVDGDEGRQTLETLEQEHGRLPATLRVSTPNGGEHIYFQYPPGTEVRNSAGKLGPGIDVRGEGGYVLAPPSYLEAAHA